MKKKFKVRVKKKFSPEGYGSIPLPFEIADRIVKFSKAIHDEKEKNDKKIRETLKKHITRKYFYYGPNHKPPLPRIVHN